MSSLQRFQIFTTSTVESASQVPERKCYTTWTAISEQPRAK